jgi:hypothetical protein
MIFRDVEARLPIDHASANFTALYEPQGTCSEVLQENSLIGVVEVKPLLSFIGPIGRLWVQSRP